MDVILVSVGSDGDVLPLVWLVPALRARGHAVTLIAPIVYADLAAAHGAGFVPLSSAEAHERRVRDTCLLSSRYSGLFGVRYARDWNATIFQRLKTAPALDTVVVSVRHGLLWADLRAACDLNLPVVRASMEPPPIAPRREALPDGRVQRALDRLYAATLAGCLPVAAGGNAERAAVLRDELPRLGLWPEWLTGGAAATGHENPVGFILPPAPPGEACGLRSHIVFVAGTRGTSAEWMRRFDAASAAVCEALSIDGVLLGSRGVTDSAGRLRRAGFTDLSAVLSGARLIVHHGGIGTAARAIWHGVPQLIVPRVFGQPSNAEWLRRLGVAAVLDADRYSVRQAPAIVESALRDERCRERSRLLGPRMNRDGAIQAACTRIEAVAHAVRAH